METIRIFLKKNYFLLLILAVLTVFFYFFYLYRPDLLRNLPRNICSTAAFNLKMNQTRAVGDDLHSVVNYFYDRWSYMPGIFYPGIAEWYAYRVPLSQFFLTLSFSIFGVKVSSIVLVGGIASFLAAVLTFFLGKEIGGKLVGGLGIFFNDQFTFFADSGKSGLSIFQLGSF